MKKSLGPHTYAFPTPVWIIGTYDRKKEPNLMAAAWAGICCSKPPCVTVSLRKATYTYGNLMHNKAFTVNIPSDKHVREADLLGVLSGRRIDKIAEAGLTVTRSALVNAPIVMEFPLVLECQLLYYHELGLHTLFIGEILDVKAEESIIDEKIHPDIEKAKPFVFNPATSTYHGMGSFLGPAFSIRKDLEKSTNGG